MLAIGFGGVFDPLALMLGLTRTPAATASLLLNLEAVLTAVLAWVVFRVNTDHRIVLGMLLIVAGAVLLTLPGSPQSAHLGWGALAISGACLCWALDNNFTRKVPASDAPFIAGSKALVAGIVNVGIALARDVGRVNIGFMGCHGAFNGLRAAAALVHEAPEARVLLCCVELCSLHFAYGFNRQRVVANALFADGAAAAILAPAGQAALHLHDTASLLTRDSAGAMTWRIGDHGFEMGLTLEVPRRIRASLREWLEPWLATCRLRIGDVAHWAIHPGGPEIVQAVIDALGIRAEAGDVSRAILAEHGNMSSPTILFILQRMRARRASGPIVALGFGPGLVFEAALLG